MSNHYHLEGTMFRIPSHNLRADSFRIGTVRLTEDTTFRRTYETAAWFQDVIVPAGTEATLRTNGYYVFVTFAGVKGESNFTSRIGAHYGTPKRDEGMGQADSYGVQAYGYAAAKAIATGTFLDGAEVTLDPGFGIACEPYEHDPDAGWSWGFTMEDEDEKAARERRTAEREAREAAAAERRGAKAREDEERRERRRAADARLQALYEAREAAPAA